MSTAPNHHTPHRRFRNPTGSPPRDIPRSELVRFFARRALKGLRLPRPPEGLVLSSEQARHEMNNAAAGPALTWLGHASFLVRLAHKNVLIDPFLSKTAGPGPFGPRRFVPPPITIDDLPPIDILLVTHNHYDHLDAGALKRLPGKDRMRVLVPLRLGATLKRYGFRRVDEVDWYEATTLDSLRVIALPAVHWSKRGLFDENRSLWASFALQGDGLNIFCSGDTAYGDVFSELGDTYGPFDLALMSIGAYEPRSVMKPSHATPEEVAQIAIDLRAAAVLGMHWGTVVLSDEDPFEPPERFHAATRAQGFPENRIWSLPIGATRSLATLKAP